MGYMRMTRSSRWYAAWSGGFGSLGFAGLAGLCRDA